MKKRNLLWSMMAVTAFGVFATSCSDDDVIHPEQNRVVTEIRKSASM